MDEKLMFLLVVALFVGYECWACWLEYKSGKKSDDE